MRRRAHIRDYVGPTISWRDSASQGRQDDLDLFDRPAGDAVGGPARPGSELRAAAIVSDVRIKNPDSDAIRLEVEHREGVAMAVLLSYRIQKRLIGREVAYGDMIGEAADQKIWPPST